MAKAAAVQHSQFQAEKVRLPQFEADRETLRSRDFRANGEAYARALQAKLDRAFDTELVASEPVKLTPLMSASVIIGTSAVLWCAIGYIAHLYLF